MGGLAIRQYFTRKSPEEDLLSKDQINACLKASGSPPFLKEKLPIVGGFPQLSPWETYFLSVESLRNFP